MGHPHPFWNEVVVEMDGSREPAWAPLASRQIQLNYAAVRNGDVSAPGNPVSHGAENDGSKTIFASKKMQRYFIGT